MRNNDKKVVLEIAFLSDITLKVTANASDNNIILSLTYGNNDIITINEGYVYYNYSAYSSLVRITSFITQSHNHSRLQFFYNDSLRLNNGSDNLSGTYLFNKDTV
jgi:hypothetical protein